MSFLGLIFSEFHEEEKLTDRGTPWPLSDAIGQRDMCDKLVRSACRDTEFASPAVPVLRALSGQPIMRHRQFRPIGSRRIVKRFEYGFGRRDRRRR